MNDRYCHVEGPPFQSRPEGKAVETFATTADFRAWCERYPNAYVVNVVGPEDEMLHRAECMHLGEFTDRPANLVNNPNYGFYMRDRARSYHPNARLCATCSP
jgi:hypothetical protein